MGVMLPGLVQTGTVQSKTNSLRSSLVFRLRWTGLLGSLPQTGTVRTGENIGFVFWPLQIPSRDGMTNPESHPCIIRWFILLEGSSCVMLTAYKGLYKATKQAVKQLAAF